MKKFLLAGAALVALGGAASAADLAVKARPYAPPPAFSWTGFYIGANVGGGWGTKEWNAISMAPGFGVPGVSLAGEDVTASHTVNGFLGGVQGGFNWQVGPTVWGVEAQWSGSDIKGFGGCFHEIGFGVASFDTNFTCSAKVRSLGSVAGRFGLTWDHTMVYVKGGAGFANDRFNLHGTGNVNFPPATTFNFAEITETRWGGMVGAGVEQAIGGGWSAKVEYNYLNLGTKTYTFSGAAIVPGGVVTPISFTTDIRQNLHLIKFGINYRFGWGYGGVVAAY